MGTGILTFWSDRFAARAPDDDVAPEADPHGRDLAAQLLNKLKSLPGVQINSDDPVQEHDQWAFDLSMKARRYRVAVHVVDESPAQTRWAVQIWERVGMLKSLFRSKDECYEVDECAIDIMGSILRETPGVVDVAQLSLEEFREIY